MCLYNFKNSSKWAEMNVKEPHNLQGSILPLQKYQLLLVDQLMENIGMFHSKLWLLKKMVNFKEPFSVLIKHPFSAIGVALEWKTSHSFLRKHLFWSSIIVALFTLGLFSSLLAVKKLRDLLDLKFPAQVLPTFWLPTHNASESCKWANRRIMEIIWDFELIPFLE